MKNPLIFLYIPKSCPDYGWFSAQNDIPYSAGISYHFRLEIDVPNHKYDAFVTPPGGSEQTIALNRAFRSVAGQIGQLDHWYLYSGDGTIEVCDFQVTGASGCVDDLTIHSLINRWSVDNSDVTIVQLIRSLEQWKEGCN